MQSKATVESAGVSCRKRSLHCPQKQSPHFTHLATIKVWQTKWPLFLEPTRPVQKTYWLPLNINAACR